MCANVYDSSFLIKRKIISILSLIKYGFENINRILICIKIQLNTIFYTQTEKF